MVHDAYACSHHGGVGTKYMYSVLRIYLVVPLLVVPGWLSLWDDITGLEEEGGGGGGGT